MISGIDTSSFYSYSSMNDYRLSQALTSKNAAAVETVAPVAKTKSGLSSEATKFLKDYQDNLNSLASLAQRLSNNQRASATNALGVTSSNSAVLSASASYPVSQAASYTVDVQQLAAAQINISDAVRGDGAPSAGGSFVLETARGSYEFEIDASQAQDNRELYTELAKEINRLKTGVIAQVVEDGGKVALALSGENTGGQSGFSVSGDFAQQTGLDAVVQSARDAVYSVSKDGGRAQTFTSQDNTVTVGGYQIEAELKSTGTARVDVGADRDAIGDALGQLVDQYNKTISLLDQNSDRGTGVVRQLRRLIQTPTSIDSMKKVGVNVKSDGSYVFDRQTFNAAYEKNPSLVREIIGGDYGIAQGLQRDAQAGLNTPSASLVNAEKQQKGLSSGSNSGAISGLFGQEYDRSAFQMLSTYSRSGAYNMLNYYAVGALMNMYV